MHKKCYLFQRHRQPHDKQLVGSPLNCCWLEGGWPGRAAARALWLTDDTRELSAFMVVMLCMLVHPLVFTLQLTGG